MASEEDVLINITNHGSSIHQAGFLSSDTFFGLSHDETFSLYRLESAEQPDKDPAEPGHVAFGDLRSVLNCEYVVDVLGSGDAGSAIVCAGSHRFVTHIDTILVLLNFSDGNTHTLCLMLADSL